MGLEGGEEDGEEDRELVHTELATLVASPRIQIPDKVYASDLLNIYFNVLGDNVHDDDDDGSVKEKENHNHDGAHGNADANNNFNNNEAVADPRLTVEVIMLMTRSWLLRLEFPYQPGNFRSHQTSFYHNFRHLFSLYFTKREVEVLKVE